MAGVVIQGSNNPLVIQFDADVSGIPVLVVSLWCDLPGFAPKPIKTWTREEMRISDDTAVCQLAESDTAGIPTTRLTLEAKGLDGDGNTVFWDGVDLDVKMRHDRRIALTQTGG